MCEIFFYCHMSYIFLSINKYFGYVLLTNESFHWTVSWWRLTIRPLYSHCECLSYNRKKHWKSGTETVNFKAVQCSFLVQALAHFSLLISIIFIRVNEIQGPTLELSLILFFSVLGLILHFPLTQKKYSVNWLLCKHEEIWTMGYKLLKALEHYMKTDFFYYYAFLHYNYFMQDIGKTEINITKIWTHMKIM